MTTSIKENISKNIAKYRKEKGLSQSALAEMVGAKNLTTVSSWERGISSPDADTIIKLCSLFDITLYDLYEINSSQDTMTASQKDFLSKYEYLDTHGKRIVNMVLDEEHSRCTALKETSIIYNLPCAYDLAASAGTGEYAMDIAHFKTVGLSEKPPKGADFLIRISGNSMEPKFCDGDNVFVKRDDAVAMGEIGLFYLDGDVYVKKQGDGELISLNPEYKPIPVKEFSSSKCFGKILGKCESKIFDL